MVQVREGNAPARRKTLVEILTSKGLIALVFALVVLGGYTTVNNAIMLETAARLRSRTTHPIFSRYPRRALRVNRLPVLPRRPAAQTLRHPGSQYLPHELPRRH